MRREAIQRSGAPLGKGFLPARFFEIGVGGAMFGDGIDHELMKSQTGRLGTEELLILVRKEFTIAQPNFIFNNLLFRVAQLIMRRLQK